ncbi:hypothetical protein M430DRAFT_134332 [Amorphotheca resinae ATCC 22711]|uniref:Rab-GAP TBC domain-containing protein n=1 Tax=Amorphotheca resinae ATCC 22711 TaxID=857342 RepID=A0A2T3BBH1_AMORE|nr:hypothetical protein M430DRAFT_134332 [Amorphotheca resinae ATCC 22711]PSS25672.1 hypothetical protein M430DRAFT_134332 [Amorphotheca resinae ATCC 22711]
MEFSGTIPEENANTRGSAGSSPPQDEERVAKAKGILEACRWKDVETLRALSTSKGGLLSDDIRRQAWPLLLGYDCDGGGVDRNSGDIQGWRSLPKHRDEGQVQLDVDRSFIYYPVDQSPKEIDRRKEELSDLILEVLRRQPYLHYFQGYHDICQVFLLVLEPRSRASAVSRLSALRIRDYMLPTLAPSLAQLRLIPSIIRTVDPKLYNHLPLTQPFFAIPGILTMYAHDIQEYGDIARIFDVLLAREAVFSVYMFAQIILQRADELFEIPADEPEVLHSILSKLPKPLDIETLIANTVKLFEKHPPETLRTWRAISKFSVLKTARLPDQVLKESIEDGEMYFYKQVKDLQWTERREKVLKTMWKYRRPVRTIGLAILVGVLSFWLRKSSGFSGILGAFWRWSGYSGYGNIPLKSSD